MSLPLVPALRVGMPSSTLRVVGRGRHGDAERPAMAFPCSAWERGAYRATRDMMRIRDSVLQLPPEDGHSVVMELEHLAKLVSHGDGRR